MGLITRLKKWWTRRIMVRELKKALRDKGVSKYLIEKYSTGMNLAVKKWMDELMP